MKNIYLIGFMGTGKSVVGQALATCLEATFVDVDHMIEAEQGQPITQLFAEKGEAFFRQLEKAFIEKGHPESGCVVSCGGGLPCQPGMLDRLKAKGHVISLTAEPDTILERVESNNERPLLNVVDPKKRILDLLQTRQTYYAQADFCIATDQGSTEAIAKEIIEKLKTENYASK